jgi:phage tail sheath protein FI
MDGNHGVVDSTYTSGPWDVSSPFFNRLFDKGFGLVKFATPGVTSAAVQQAGKAYAAAKNYQYRYEVLSSIVTESAAITYVNDTLGRDDFVAVAFPSYYSGIDPNDTGEGKWKEIPLTGLIHGREARMAADYDGYHKAAAGVDAKLPGVLAIPTLEAVLDEEQLNPQGLQVIKKKKGNFVIWGDRIPFTDPTWKWKHQREQMSYYEHVLQENFDWIIFMINDPITQPLALVALQTFFLPEWTPKRALRGDTFEEAAILKVDNEINTDATRDAGDMHAKVSLRLADTIERFIIEIGKQGIFESVA